MGCYLAIDNLNRIALSIKKAFTCPFSKGQVIWRFAAFFAQGKVKKVLFSKNLPAFFSFFLFTAGLGRVKGREAGVLLIESSYENGCLPEPRSGGVVVSGG